MSCSRIRRLIGIYRELDRPERRMLAAHLRSCQRCQVAWRNEQELLRRVRAIPDLEPPAGLEGRLLRIPSLPAAQPRLRLLPRLLPLLLLVLGGLAGLSGGAVILLGEAPWGGAGQPAASGLPSEPDSAARSDAAAAPMQPGASDPSLDEARLSAPIERQVERPLRTPRPAAPTALAALPDRAASGSRPGLPGGGVDPNGAPASSSRRSGSDEAPDSAGGPDAGPRERPSAPDPTRQPPPAPTEPPSEPRPTELAQACVDLTLRIAADCPVCEGAAPDPLPALPEDLFWSVYDARSMALGEGSLQAAGRPRLEASLDRICGVLPLTVELHLTDPDWATCPASGTDLQRLVRSAGAHDLDFSLSRGCPVPTSTPSPGATEPPDSPTASPTPSPRPTSLIAAETPGSSEPDPGRTSQPPGPPPPSAQPPQPLPPPPGPEPDPGQLERHAP